MEFIAVLQLVGGPLAVVALFMTTMVTLWVVSLTANGCVFIMRLVSRRLEADIVRLRADNQKLPSDLAT